MTKLMINLGGLLTAILLSAYLFAKKMKNKDRRSYSLPRSFPLQTTIQAALEFEQLMHFFLRSTKDMLLKYNISTWHFKTLVSDGAYFSSGSPHFVLTHNLENIKHILNNIHNYGKGPVVSVRFQDFLGTGIFVTDGDVWYHHRKTSAPLFNTRKFKTTILSVFNANCDILETLLKCKSENKSPVEFQSLMYSMTLDSIGKIAFGYNFHSLQLRNQSDFFGQAFDYCQKLCSKSFIDPFWRFKRYFSVEGWWFHYCIWRLNRFLYKIIRIKRQEIQRDMIRTTTGDDNQVEDVTEISGMEEHDYDLLTMYFRKESAVEPYTDKYLRDVMLNFIIAGRDTTALSLSWFMFEMCLHPEEQSRIRQEILEAYSTSASSIHPVIMNSQGGDKYPSQMTFESLTAMKYLEAACLESLRLHPAVPIELKYTFQDDILPDGTPVYKGDMVGFAPWTMARLEELWEDALSFNPSRFLTGTKFSPYLYNVFQAGPRVCLGQNLALLQMKCVAARLLSQFSVTLAQSPESVTYEQTITLPIKGGLKLRFEKLEGRNSE